MGNTKVVLNLPGFYQLRTSPEMRSMLLHQADVVKARAGAGYESAVKVGRATSVARVFPTTPAAMRAEAKHGVLSKAVGGWGR